jgi:hypothetical protein
MARRLVGRNERARVLRTRAVVALLVAGVLTAANSASPSPPLSVANFRSQAKAICAKASTDTSQPSGTTTLAVYEAARQATAKEVNALAHLKPPPSLIRLHSAAVIADAKALSAFSALVSRVKREHLSFGNALAAFVTLVGKPSAAVDAIWKKMGVPAC